MQLSDAERDQLAEALSRHAADGRLELDELERRVATVYSARSREQALVALADLPPLPSTQPVPRRRRGHGDAAKAAPDWRPTSERFRDPGSGRVMRVWLDTAGGRHYVADEEGGVA